ncbi:MAG: Maf family protein [Synergistaceae bacterium]|jgi:septum formation protein|nr:Maf family protein [Synergistaceae bacterium]
MTTKDETRKNFHIVLASGSPRRRDLLRALSWDFEVAVSEADESALPSETPEALCVRLAEAKAAAVAENRRSLCSRAHENDLVIGADTIVLVDGEVLGKPRDRAESLGMVRRLQGRAHEVLTGLALIWGTTMTRGLERTTVRFRPLDDAAVRAYAATGEGMDKAGAYAVQGKGALLVSAVEGDYFNVVGLPLCRLGLMIEEMAERTGASFPGLFGF